MKNEKTSKINGKPFKTLFKIWLVLLALWSLLIGTLAATGTSFLGTAVGAGGTTRGVGVVAMFIYGFFAGAFQGVAFSFIAAIALIMGVILYLLFTGKLMKSGTGGNGSDDTQSK